MADDEQICFVGHIDSHQLRDWNTTWDGTKDIRLLNLTESLERQWISLFDLNNLNIIRRFTFLHLTLCYRLELISVIFTFLYLFNQLIFTSSSIIIVKQIGNKHQSDTSRPTRYLTYKRIIISIQLAVCIFEFAFKASIFFFHNHSDVKYLLSILIRLVAFVCVTHHHFRLRRPADECPGSITISLFWLASTISLVLSEIFKEVPISHLATTSTSTGSVVSIWRLCNQCSWNQLPSNHAIFKLFIFSHFDHFLISFNLFLTCIQLILSFGSNFKSKLHERTSPEAKATFFSRLLFTWLDSIIYRGYRRLLTRDDIYEVSEEDRIEIDVQRFNHLLSKPLIIEGATSRGHLRLILVLFQQYRWQLAKIVFIKIFPTVLIFLGPIFLDCLIAFFKRNPKTLEPVWHGYLYVALMFSVSFGESILNSLGDYHTNKLALQIRSCLIVTIYDRLWDGRQRWAETRRFSLGSILNIMSVDTQRVMDLVKMINLVWICPLQIGISIWLLWQHLRYGSLAGLGVLVLFILPLNTFIGARMRSLQKCLLIFKDQRIKRLSETLANMVAVKLYAWEEFFQHRIVECREKEVRNLRRQAAYSAFITFAFNSASFFVALTSFWLYILTENSQLDARKIFVSMAIFNIIRRPLAFFPQLITTGLMFLVSLKRITDFLELDKFGGPSNRLNEKPSSSILKSLIVKSQSLKPKICLRDCIFRWPTWNEGRKSLSDFALKNITLEIDKPELVAIIGEIGSGKSSLLAAILGQMSQEMTSNEEFVVDGKISYVPQTAWIQNATIRENILFAEPYDAQRYRRVIMACALVDDLRRLKDRDQTIVGEKGASLSGGQRQRISIARAVYREADIYLLDDPLSALDAQVSRHVFDQVLGPSGLLANKIRLLVTHKYGFLPHVDNIMLMANGRVVCRGSYEELTAKNDTENEFVQFLASYLVASFSCVDGAGDIDQSIETSNEEDKKKKDDGEDYEILEQMATRLERRFSSFSIRSSQVRRQSSNKSQVSSNNTKYSTKTDQKKLNKKIHNENSVKTKKTLASLEDAEVEQSECQCSLWLICFRYFQLIGPVQLMAIITFFIIGHVFVVLTNLWLSDWSNTMASNDQTLAGKENSILTTKLSDLLPITSSLDRLYVYASLGICQTIFILIATWLLNIGCLRASSQLHSKALSSILCTPIAFFELTPIGQILNRLTKDVDTVDGALISSVRLFMLELFRTIVSIYIICVATTSTYILLLFLPMIGLYFVIYKFYISASRQLIRLEAILRTPIYSIFEESFAGLAIVKTFEAVDRFKRRCRAVVEENTSAALMSIASARWLNIRLEFLGNAVVLVTAWFCVLYHEKITPGMAGLAIFSALTVTGTLNLLIRSSTELENNLISIERLVSYTKLVPEAAWHRIISNIKVDNKFKKSISNVDANNSKTLCPARSMPTWLHSGSISFCQYSARYRSGLELCLKEINLYIPHGIKVGVVGRTGAGKSSFANALFRLIEPEIGCICIGGRNIQELGLHELRSALTVIPQEPFIFSGTLRENLDTMGEFSDHEIIEALRNAHLADLVGKLDLVVDECHLQSLSSGRKQLLCLARALLRQSKVLVLDEATAAIDPGTIELIQKAMRQLFIDRTILTIVHQLNTVMDYDAILVLSDGRLVEYDSPKRLLVDKNSHFYKMVKNGF